MILEAFTPELNQGKSAFVKFPLWGFVYDFCWKLLKEEKGVDTPTDEGPFRLLTAESTVIS